MTDKQRNQRENEITLLAVQALLGMISTDVIAVAVRAEEARVEVVFWAHRQSSELEEVAEEVTFELDALFPEDHPLVECVIKIGEPDPKSNSSECRMIYWAKPDAARISDE
ncbi:hypothetical protein ACFCV8_18220 [Streptomyces sp. NPDC056347]|uniref:hypothetical protein n=1 Tax=Streptomyces sp. NPDC056347 TaxID=3345790 RepID=UPI0035DAC71C